MFKRTIQVIEIERYRDGGTIHYQDKSGDSYYVDNRIGTKTPGRITDKYPSDSDAIGEHVELVIVDKFDTKAYIA